MQNPSVNVALAEKFQDKDFVQPFDEKLEQAVGRARSALLALQDPEGYWCFELEADCTIPAEYIMMMHYMDEIDAGLEAKIAVYLRSHQCEETVGGACSVAAS